MFALSLPAYDEPSGRVNVSSSASCSLNTSRCRIDVVIDNNRHRGRAKMNELFRHTHVYMSLIHTYI